MALIKLYCDGVFTLTSTNAIHVGQSLYCNPEESFYATQNYVNIKIDLIIAALDSLKCNL